MDSHRFDRLTRLVAASHSRRALGGVVASAVAGLIAVTRPGAAAAHNPLPSCRHKPTKRQRRACRTRAKRHNARHRSKSCAGVACPAVRNGTARCRQGVCVIGACTAGFGNCDRRFASGCEADLLRNVNHCGRCGNVCSALGQPATSVSCVAGTCRLERSFSTPTVGGSAPYTVAANGRLTILALGAGGGDGGAGQNRLPALGGGDGEGAGGTRVLHRLPVAAGEQFQIIVGGAGANGDPGFVGGAGGSGGFLGTAGQPGTIGASGSSGGGGGGGGGFSQVQRPSGNNAIVVIAGGGGGGGGGGGAADSTAQSGGTGGTGGISSSPHGGVGGAGGPAGSGANGNGGAGQPGGAGSGFPMSAEAIEPDFNAGSGQVIMTLEIR